MGQWHFLHFCLTVYISTSRQQLPPTRIFQFKAQHKSFRSQWHQHGCHVSIPLLLANCKTNPRAMCFVNGQEEMGRGCQDTTLALGSMEPALLKSVMGQEVQRELYYRYPSNYLLHSKWNTAWWGFAAWYGSCAQSCALRWAAFDWTTNSYWFLISLLVARSPGSKRWYSVIVGLSNSDGDISLVESMRDMMLYKPWAWLAGNQKNLNVQQCTIPIVVVSNTIHFIWHPKASRDLT